VEKIVNKNGKLVLIREPWMQALWEATYPMTVMEAVTNGFTGSFERVLSRQLRWMYQNQLHLGSVCSLLDETGIKDSHSDASFYRAAQLIIESETKTS